MSRNDNVEELFQAAWDLEPHARASFLTRQCNGDTALLAELRRLLESSECACRDSFWDSSALEAEAARMVSGPPDRAGEIIGRYRIRSVISSGGMGTVFLAVRDDSEYEQKVAIKVIKRGMDTDLIVHRFRTERQILANLRHPNIASLLDGGATSDGLPYLVMEHVEGDPIDGYAEKRQLTIRQRLQLFRTVCLAVEYAHRNLVIHRDLKPGNILVTAEGVPKLLDFGIAKLLGPEGGQETAMPFMTPEYASPEQARGDAVTTGTDVYSLGVLLRRLLTGQAPREGSRALDGDLENIVLMALRSEPERRYSSVASLAEDIRLSLAGRPVMAHRDSPADRLGKFVRRNRVGAAAGALVLLSMIGGVAGVAWEAHIARVQRARAERRFNDVRKLANSFLFEFHDSIQNIPGTLSARQHILKRALEYLDSLAQEAGGDRALQYELAQAYDRAGSMTFDVPVSLDAHRRALAISRSLTRAEPGNLKYREQLATSDNLVGGMLRETGNTPGALRSLQDAVSEMELLVRRAPANRQYQSELADAYGEAGVILLEAGRNDSALANGRKALALHRTLLSATPGNRQYQRAVMLSCIQLIRPLGESGNFQEALEDSRSALAIARSLNRSDPSSATYQRDLWLTHWRLAESHEHMGNPREALAEFRTALSYIADLAAADPGDKGHRRGVAINHLAIANLLAALGRTTGAVAEYHNAIAASEALLAADPQKAETHVDLAGMRSALGGALLKSGALSGAAGELARSRAIFEETSRQDPGNITLLRGRANLYERLGTLRASQALHAVHKLDLLHEAKSFYEESLSIWTGMRERNQLRRMDAAVPEHVARELAATILTIRRAQF